MKLTTPKRCTAALLIAASSLAHAAADFPDGATAPEAAAIREHLGNRTFSVALADGTTWRLQYTAAGYFFVDVSNGFKGNGSWNAENGKLCTALRGNAVACSDVRMHEGTLIVRRSSGEIIRLLPK